MSNPHMERLRAFLRQLEETDVPDDELADVAAAVDEEIREYREIHGRLMYHLLTRMHGREQSQLLTRNQLVTIIPPNSEYVWDAGKLAEARPLLAPGEYDKLVYEELPVKPVLKVQTRQLLSLAAKRKGRLEEIVTSAYEKRPRGTDRLAFEPIIEGEE
jgi:hypothetical protein